MNLWPPTLVGALVRLRPLRRDDFEPLYQVASDPGIWEQHPDRERWRPDRFRLFFDSGIASGGALVVHDQLTGRLIGSSRFYRHDPVATRVEVGYTFLARDFWRTGHNRELKFLMLNEAFSGVTSVGFVVGAGNLRSQRAVLALGATETGRESGQIPGADASLTYTLVKETWLARAAALAPAYGRAPLSTHRLELEPITERHAGELRDLFADEELHRYVESVPPSLADQHRRCARWARGRSPDGGELWLNWAARERASGRVIGHLQAGIRPDGVASVGYLFARDRQGQGLAFESMTVVLAHLRKRFAVREARAWTDPRNAPSRRLAARLGMDPVERHPGARDSEGAAFDEIVFAKKFWD